jgi:hypothetical protein
MVLPQLGGLIFEDDSTGLYDPLQWQNQPGTQEPLYSTNWAFDGTNWSWTREGAAFVIPSASIPVQTYSNFQLSMRVFADPAGEEHQKYSLWVLNDPTRGALTGFGDTAIDPDDLLGPVAWDQSGVNWGSIPSPPRVTPNIASLVNPVVNHASWSAPSSRLYVVLEVVDPVPPQDETTHDPGGRWVYLDILDTTEWLGLIYSP